MTSLSATFPHLTAVIHEIWRIFPPIPFGTLRIVPPRGETVDGFYIPGRISLIFYSWN
jgi:hypothetical protein